MSNFLPCQYPTDPKQAERVAACDGITVEAAFIPWSKSRNAGEKNPSLNWRVRVLHNGREVTATDYSAGMAHAPAYNAKPPAPNWRSIDGFAALKEECETGKAARHGSLGIVTNGAPILPNALDVLHALALDGCAIDCATFEEWAAGYGYDPDSRKAEGIYRACLEIGLKLRAGLGDARLTALREALRDY